MRIQQFLLNLKKILSYPFNWEFISLQQKAAELLDKLCNSYYTEMKKEVNSKVWDDYQYTANLEIEVNNCWNIHDVTQLLKFKIDRVFEVAGWLNIPIFDKKTGWFLWKNIFEWADRIDDPDKKTVALRQLNLLQQISSTFDLGK